MKIPAYLCLAKVCQTRQDAGTLSNVISISITERRRVLQRLWNQFDQYLAPYLNNKMALCVSGGADSMALLESVARWPHRHDGLIHVFAVDHGVRSESTAEADAVVARARVLGFDASLLKIPALTKSDEATLRAHRYEIIWQQARCLGIQAICTAHHEDDEAESFLMDLFGLGGGEDGSAMEPVLKTKNGYILRPFLTTSKRYLLMALTAMDAVHYFSDPTNEIGRGKRTAVRQLMQVQFRHLHTRPSSRIASIARKRRSQTVALAREAQKLIHIEDGDRIRVELPLGTSNAIYTKAVSMGLKALSPTADLRQSTKTIDAIVRHALDPITNSFTVSNQLKRFDLNGVRAILTNHGIWLQRR